MGKRELVIALAFVLVGIIAYQFEAPPTASGRGFSFSQFLQSAHRQLQGDRAEASFTARGTIPVRADWTEVRVSHISHSITITGEPRTDIGYELAVNSTGPDEPTALASAKRTVLTQDDLGSALALGADYPPEGSQVAELTLHVPNRLAVRIDNASGAHVRIEGVAGVRFEGVSGDAVLKHVSGAVTGGLRSGSFSVIDAASLDLSLQAVTATIDGISQTATLTVRSGRCTLSHVAGTVGIDATNTEVVVTEPAGTVHIGATGGHVSVSRPGRATDIEGHRTGIEVTVAAAVPMTLLTSDDELRLSFPLPPPAVRVEATAAGGSIHADDVDLTVTSDDHTEHLAHDFGGPSAPRIVMRNQRGEIVISRAK